ncbi:MAG: hypothetical protein DDT42_02110 [candidate division WS2 bacterium]|uniref:Uncharacterized protein n=1 Tax=Psychracetigena formicireducens TaxID=2986056 RepID=A0A9E2BIJ3_PSYF1|nr:hypothetical protein [Candidatus Psychracetigena formicireducens]
MPNISKLLLLAKLKVTPLWVENRLLLIPVFINLKVAPLLIETVVPLAKVKPDPGVVSNTPLTSNSSIPSLAKFSMFNTFPLVESVHPDSIISLEQVKSLVSTVDLLPVILTSKAALVGTLLETNQLEVPLIEASQLEARFKLPPLFPVYLK